MTVQFSVHIDQIYTIGHVVVLLVFIKDRTRFDRSQQLNFVFDMDCIFTIKTSLSYPILVTINTRSNWSPQFNIVFNINCTYMIKYVVVMFVFPHRLYQVQSITTIQNCFWCRLYLLDQSRCYPIQFSSLIALDQISLNSSVWVLTQTRSGLIDHDSSVSFSA